MSFKTEKLVKLFPQAYSVRDTESLLYKLLDSLGAELMAADESMKKLLKSHWINYADGAALDGLGGIYGVARRRLPDGSSEPDDIFRLRLKSTVPLFAGGGTCQAVKGAVRSALGLPFNLDLLNLPEGLEDLRTDIEGLVQLVEFSPNPELLIKDVDPANPGELMLNIPVVSVKEEWPRIQWRFTRGGGRRLRLERLDTGEGIQSDDSFIVPEGETLQLFAESDGTFNAFVGTTDVSAHFSALGGGDPILPEVPGFPSDWYFSADGGLFDHALLDRDDTFDRPLFQVEMTWRSYEPLTFDVYVPYFLKQTVEDLKQKYGYDGDIFVYEGLDLQTIQTVVNQTRAAGVRGDVHFSLIFRANHTQQEALAVEGQHLVREDADALEEFTVSSGAQFEDTHEVNTHFGLGGVYDVGRFDGDFVFL